MTVKATASSSSSITGWQVYLDGSSVASGGASSSLSTSVTASTGSHQMVVRAWDASGAYSSQTATVNVSSTSNSTSSNGALSVSLSSPSSGATVTSPMTVAATASSSKSITGWQVYLDGTSVASGGSTNSLSTSVTASTGSHQLVVRAWDASGAYSSQTATVTVSGTGASTGSSSTGLPTPPSTATVYSNIDQMTGWESCGTAACAGGSGKSAYWLALNQTSPSMDGNSLEVYNSGVWANALWWKKMGAKNAATNMLWDYYIYLDDNSTKYGQSLEYDMFQFVGGYNYMIGTQCNYGAGVWDTWNEASGSWIHTSIACPKFSTGTWHHIQWYVTMNHSNHSYTYKTLVVDGKAYTLNQTQYAKYLAWSDNIGVQYQLDVNATGSGFHEWVDKSKLTIW